VADKAAPALYSARPKITVDGRQSDPLTANLLSVLVEETTEGLYRCEARFLNWGSASGKPDYLYFDRSLLDFGKPLKVTMGGGDVAGEVFDGRIAGIEGIFPQLSPPEIAVLAEDRFQDLRMNRRTRTFDDVSDSDVINRIASAHGLRADVDVDGPTHRVLAQVNQSDLKFLRDRARAIDAELWMEGDTLHAQSRARRDGGTVTLTYQQRLYEISLLADIAGQRSSLSVTGWDVASKEAIESEAGGSAISGEMNGLTGGGSILGKAFGERKERVVHLVPFTGEEARAEAEARYRAIARRFITGSGACEGDGRIRVGCRVELRGLGPLFEGKYYVTMARHTFDGTHGYRTIFNVERPGIGSGSS
jgi:uncharacterized protein